MVVRLKTDDPSDAAPRSAAAKRSNTEALLRAVALRRVQSKGSVIVSSLSLENEAARL